MRRFVLSTAVVMVIAMLAGACGGAGAKPSASVSISPAAASAPPKFGTNGEPDDPSTLDRPEDSHSHLDWAPAPNFASFVAHSHAAVVGRVTNIGPAQWNTSDGKPTADERGWKFRDAILEVEQVVYDSQQLRVQTGQQLTIRLFGDGTDTGTAVEGAEPVKHANAISGPVAVGDRVLWVLEALRFAFLGPDMSTPARLEDVVKLMTHFYGAWLVDLVADQAKSVVPSRTVPFQALVGRLKAERANPGDTGRGTRGRDNPLE